jgi:protein-S-isoprenylcysteine O-methyltransferase Ste14
MPNTKDNPGVVIPPPLVYAAVFFLSLSLQRLLPLNKSFFRTSAASVIGTVFIIAGLFLNVPALRQFIKTKNTVVTIRPANSLQTTGIYAVSRNPMYLSLLLIYTGLSFLVGNWWTLLLLPLLAAIVNHFIIRPEERYLERAFGQAYLDYKVKVRRWL